MSLYIKIDIAKHVYSGYNVCVLKWQVILQNYNFTLLIDLEQTNKSKLLHSLLHIIKLNVIVFLHNTKHKIPGLRYFFKWLEKELNKEVLEGLIAKTSKL